MIETGNHGGDIYSYKEKYGKYPLDFSSSISPFKTPDEIKNVINYNKDHIYRYPDPYLRRLKLEIAKKYDILVDNIVIGNGATDLIYRIKAVCNKRNYNNFLLKNSGFFEYKKLFFHEKEGEPDLIITERPKNPTGVLLKNDETKELIKKHPYSYFLFDETFTDFIDKRDERDLIIDLIREQDNKKIISLRAFTKFYGMAGLRLGFLISNDRELVFEIENESYPWEVSYLSEEAGIAALNMGDDFNEKVRSYVKREREYLYLELKKLGIKCIENARANFIAFYSRDDLHLKLMENGILIRDFPEEKGMFRIAVKLHEENERLIDSIKEILKLG